LHHIEFWLYASILEEHTAFIFSIEGSNVKKCMVYSGLGEGSVYVVWSVSHGRGRCVQVNSRDSFVQYQKGRLGQERERKNRLFQTGMKGWSEELLLKRIIFHSFGV
jgi:hypothetical protein